MPTVDFYYMPESAPCRTVEMVASMVGVNLNKHHLNLFAGEHKTPDYLKLNPAHKVPFIVDGDLKMNESRAIAAYLVNKYAPADNTLYPRDPVERARVDELLYFDMDKLFSSASNLTRPLFRGATKFDPESEKVCREALSYLNDCFEKNGGKKFILGDKPTIVDVTIASSLSLLEACEYDLSKFKFINSHLNNLKSVVPKYDEINVGPMENTKNMIKKSRRK